MTTEIDEAQMGTDFDGVVLPSEGGPFTRARKLVDEHIENHGAVSCSEKLRHALGVELSLAEFRGADRGRAEIVALRAQIEDLEMQVRGLEGAALDAGAY